MATDAQLKAARENGKKGGRRKGSLNKLTKLRKDAEALFIEEALKHMPEMIDALIHAANGVMIKKQNGDGMPLIYKKAPDVQALKEYFDRVFGKSKQEIAINPGDDSDMTIIFTKREQELRDRYANRKKPGTKRSK